MVRLPRYTVKQGNLISDGTLVYLGSENESGDLWKPGSFPEEVCCLKNSSCIIFQIKQIKVHFGCSRLLQPSIVELFPHDMCQSFILTLLVGISCSLYVV